MKISYQKIVRLRSDGYAARLRNQFGTVGATFLVMTEVVADWCADQGWCIRGGAATVFGGAGTLAFKRWRKTDNKVYNNYYSNNCGQGATLGQCRWRNLLKAVKREAVRRKRDALLKRLDVAERRCFPKSRKAA
ncbi:MAG: hypothetical protein ACRD34_00150 [Bryobacteraceae bacterium]